MRGRRPLQPEDLDAVEEALLAADMGMPRHAADAMEVLREPQRARSGRAGCPAMRALLREEIRQGPATGRWPCAPFSPRPWVVFVVGVNGVGKTTTIGKLAAAWKARGPHDPALRRRHLPRRGRRAARGVGRAHRARRSTAARRARTPRPCSPTACARRRAAGHDAVLVDTAGRLHTKGNLMAELAKMARVAGREVPGAPHETLLVLDATVGSNGLAQGREFAQGGGRDRARPHQARRHGQGRRGGGGGARAGRAHPLRGRGRVGWRTCCPSTRPRSRRASFGDDGRRESDGRDDAAFMRSRARARAARGLGETNPNPLVGCVVVQRRAAWSARAGTAARAGRTPRSTRCDGAGAGRPRRDRST